ncbi:hypothetical protein SAMN04487936_11275 [Halobacillus dabanensis]|uniref:Uncharacterized protein n=1 Tax=Halobacillus dabanensis TaxID=240302 RepID=A0A1I3YZL0_HALDA|nr:AimR family lysis-lysogeny pheromone receptor [Halobacillus dabanensis]SFK37255.1 hypothetical protein SAMN04487936_11275 [Halobacillus dabanensis]
MTDNQVIEPSPLRQLQMTQKSSLYDVYLNNLRYYPKSDAVLRTRDFILSHFPKDLEEQIVCLEFLYMNDFFDDLAIILSTHSINREIRQLYRILVERLNKETTKDYLDELKSLHYTHPSLHCLHLFTFVYSYHDRKVYTALDKYLDNCEQALHKVDEPLMYYYLNQRYQELLFHHYWKTDNSILASRHAYKMINTEVSPRKKSRMYHDLALCNLFNGYESSMESLAMSVKIAEGHGLVPFVTAIKNHTLPFISAFHRQTDGIVTSDPVEQAHLELARGKYEATREILQSMSSLTPFQESYLGLATKDSEMLRHSYQRFIRERGDHFFARVPLEYMKRIQS